MDALKVVLGIAEQFQQAGYRTQTQLDAEFL